MGIGIYVWQRPFSWLYLLGGVMIGVGLLLCSLLSHESIGRGDGYLFCVTGIYLGFWNNLFLLVVASVLSGIGALILLIAKRCAKTAQIPFVPFVLAAYLILLLGGSL
jgi:leader peptidase (prepilin peptidase)/N-methyltransferase